MLRRASDLATRARERIRAAREHDPHGWHERDDDRAPLSHEDVYRTSRSTPIRRRRRIRRRAPGRRPAGRRPGPRSAARSPAPRTSTAPSARAGSAGPRRAVARTARRSVPAG